MKNYPLYFFIVLLFATQLHVAAQYVPREVNYATYPVRREMPADSAILKFLKPYSDSVAKAMSKVIGFSLTTLYSKSPEGPMGNLLADAMKIIGEQKFGRKIDAAVVNPGGRPYIPKGDIKLGSIYDIMPYENLVVLQELKGAVLKQLLDHTASQGGWAFSGITMQIKDHKADSIFIGGKPLDENATYIIANADYVARGGYGAEMLKFIPQISIGYLFRDAIIEYIQQFTRQGKPVTATIENRIVNAAE